MEEHRRPDGTKKMASVLELAKYKIGAELYRVVLRPVGEAVTKISEGDEWVATVHPKVIYDYGFAKWPYKIKIPKLCGIDFQYVTEILTSEPIVERFIITECVRCTDTGEFYYMNKEEDWMPESALFKTPDQARKEKHKVKSLFAEWASKTSADEV